MTRRKRKWLIVLVLSGGIALSAAALAGYHFSKRLEPFIHEQTVAYLRERFDSEVELAALRIRLPAISSWKLLLTGGRGALAHVEGEGVVLRHKGRTDVAPLILIDSFSFDVDIATLFAPTKTVPLVTIRKISINIPPKGERPKFSVSKVNSVESVDSPEGIEIEQVLVSDCVLTVLPRDSKKLPLRFDVHQLRLESAGLHVPMRYEASLTNAKPPGEIVSRGAFGPWAADEPGDSPLAGTYTFDHADLSVFRGIAGILDSTGKFQGTLSSIDVHGRANVPDFLLKSANNRVSLKTTFDVTVDGTNGDTILKPVVGTLGTTTFTTSGAIIKQQASDLHRSISLEVKMPNGNMQDLLTLAMKGQPFMEGRIHLNARIDIPPLSGKVREKLRLEGTFEVVDGIFLKSTIQDQIDMLSRRGQGQPKNESIDNVVSSMGGSFLLDDQVMTFKSLAFSVSGSGVDLAGTYDLHNDVLDFHGILRLDAKVSQTMTGWKRWLLKPIDPFFSKNGAGTLLHIQVVGSSGKPKFGRDRGPQELAN